MKAVLRAPTTTIPYRRRRRRQRHRWSTCFLCSRREAAHRSAKSITYSVTHDLTYLVRRTSIHTGSSTYEQSNGCL